jgi:predicted hydrocarbon binding protein
VAKAVASADLSYTTSEEVKKIEKKFFDMMSNLEFLPNSPTLMNAGRPLGQLSACFVLPVEDSMEAIFEAIKNKSYTETAKEITYGQDESAKSENNAEWVKSTMHRLESKFDQRTTKQIRMRCQCGYGMDEKLALLKELRAAASNMEEFANSDKAKSAGLYSKDGTLYLQFLFCPCPMLADVDKLDTKTWCLCTTGYSKVLFEKAFGCEVEVDLLKSIKSGDDICLMKIIPHDLIWK